MEVQVKQNTIIATGTRPYGSKDWLSKKDIISKLYQQGMTQKDLLAILAVGHDFHPTPSMLKKKIREWGIDRKNKEADIAKAVRISLDRKNVGKKTSFIIKGRIIDQREIDRYLRRKGITNVAEYVTSSLKVDCSSIIPFTPPPSPSSTTKEAPVDRIGENPDDIAVPSYSRLGRVVGRPWPVSPVQITPLPLRQQPSYAGCLSLNNEPGGLYSLTITEKLLLFNDAYHDLTSQTPSHRAPSLSGKDSPVAPGISHLKTLTNGMWRGRESLLEDQHSKAFPYFQVAFSSLPHLLACPNKQFLTELYEMILNFQLGENIDVVPFLLRQVSATCAAHEEAAAAKSWRIEKIASALLRMRTPDRVATAECLIRNILSRHQSLDGPEAQGIVKILSRSLFRRKKMDKAIIYLTQQLQDTDALSEMDPYEICGLLVELAQCHRFQKRPEVAIYYLKRAWQQANGLTELFGCTDVRIRCMRTMALVEAKRGNFGLAHQFAWHAVDLAATYLDPGNSLTSLVEAELDEITSRISGLGLDKPSSCFDVESAFRTPMEISSLSQPSFFMKEFPE